MNPELRSSQEGFETTAEEAARMAGVAREAAEEARRKEAQYSPEQKKIVQAFDEIANRDDLNRMAVESIKAAGVFENEDDKFTIIQRTVESLKNKGMSPDQIDGEIMTLAENMVKIDRSGFEKEAQEKKAVETAQSEMLEEATVEASPEEKEAAKKYSPDQQKVIDAFEAIAKKDENYKKIVEGIKARGIFEGRGDIYEQILKAMKNLEERGVPPEQIEKSLNEQVGKRVERFGDTRAAA